VADAASTSDGASWPGLPP